MIVTFNKGMRLETRELECGDIRERISALTSVLKAADKDKVAEVDLYWILTMIEEHLPSDAMLASQN